MITAQDITRELQTLGNDKKAASLQRFFQTQPGGYGEGDLFVGVSVPIQRKLASRVYRQVLPGEIARLLGSGIHECRLTGVFILVLQFEKARGEEQARELVNIYLDNLESINNWDLVDSSAYKILGPWLADKDKCMLYNMARSKNIWVQRVAVIGCLYFIRNHQFDDILRLSEMLLDHPHDLIHKAVGWMLREVGKRNYQMEYCFLKKHYRQMPRTMLRYAIEQFDDEVRKGFLQGTIV